MSQTYSATQIIGKTLISKTSNAAYNGSSLGVNAVYTIPPGTTIGVVYSYVMDGPLLYWQFYYMGVPFYVQHKVGAFDIQSLEQQGALTVEQEQAALNPPGVVETIIGSAGDLIKYGLILFAGVALVKSLKST